MLMTAAQLIQTAIEKYALDMPKPQLTTSNASGGIGSSPPATQSLAPPGMKPMTPPSTPAGGLGSMAAPTPITSGIKPAGGLIPPTAKPLIPPGPAPAPAPVNPTTPVLSTPNQPLSVAQPASAPVAPAVPQMTGDTQPQPIVSNTQGTMTDTQGKPVQTSGPVAEPNKPVAFAEIEGTLSDSNIPVAQRKQFAEKFVTDHFQQNPELVQGFRDSQAGKNTPQAQAYQAKFKAAQDAHIQQQVQADPQKAATPQGYGEIVNKAMSDFQNMPPAMQAMMGIGLPMGLIGIMSSLFGGGGMGMGIMGALGLGAGVLGGAAGGMFGQGAQNMTADAAYQAGSFLGMIPEGKHDLSMLTADDPIAAVKAMGGGGISPAAIKEQLAKAEQQKQQLATLMSLPEGMRPRMLQNLSNTNMTDEQAAQAAQNAAMLHGHLNDPKSELSQLQQQGQRYVDSPFPTFATEILPQKVHAAAQGAYDYTVGNANMPWNWGKKGADMNINKLIEKWACVDTGLAANEVSMLCMKSARCWAGYEAVPGKKPYSNDSCRPVGSGKKKTNKKKSAK